MRKRGFIGMFLLFAVCGAGHAQSWCPPGARWVYHASIGNGTGTTLTYAGDTLVDGFLGQRITQWGTVVIPWNPDSIIVVPGADIVTRTEPGMVLWWLDQAQAWDTLYWFGAGPGDRWSPGWEQQFPGDGCAAQAYLQVVDTGSVVVDGVSLRTLGLERHLNATDTDLSFTIMERAGNTLQYFFPDPPYLCFINEALNFFGCYGDDEIRYPPSTLPCGSTASVRGPDPGNGTAWTVSPMPFTDQLQVRSTLPQWNSNVLLADMAGRRVLHAAFNGLQLDLDVSGLPAGTYVLGVVAADGTASRAVVIKAGQ